MTILLTGGGTGGHITPLLAVAHELKALRLEARLIYVGERGGGFGHLTANHPNLDERHYIFAGKLRRYHGESWLRRLLDVRTNLLNICDVFKVFIGFWQALSLIIRKRPDVIFIKGGFVGVPVGLAAALCRVPFVTHDSDTLPGLANRLVGRWARVHATGMPAEFYKYPADKMRYTGIPVDSNFKLVTDTGQRQAKMSLGIDTGSMLILITGGSQGSQRINTIMLQIIPKLLDKRPDVTVIHHVGQKNQDVYGDYQNPRLRIEPFIEKFYQASAAADVIVARGSATTIAEVGIQARPLVLIPSPFLAGGHQLKNAEHLASLGAVISLSEPELLKNPVMLFETLETLLDSPEERRRLSAAISALGKPAAASELAALLLEVAG